MHQNYALTRTPFFTPLLSLSISFTASTTAMSSIPHSRYSCGFVQY
jgi:hypothetical protein